jgi:hypothetical protein
MTRLIRRRLPVVVVLAVLLAGGAVAAMAAGGGTRPAGHSANADHRGIAATPRGRSLLQSATYIGISPEAVEQGLHSGKSLGQLATEAGKTEAGLVQALATTARAGLEQRLTRTVKQPGGIHGVHHRHGHPLRVAAAGYLGVTPTAISAQLRAGRTLAQIAATTPGHSRAGLIDALVAARQAQRPTIAQLLKPASKGSLTAQTTKLRQRVSALVDHGRVAKPKHTAGR